MRSLVPISAILVLLTATAFGSDQQKADKLTRRISAYAVDATARAIVSRTMCDTFAVKRAVLLQERRRMNLSYGSLFLAHELMASGAQLDDIAAAAKAGKNIVEIANQQHANWKRVAADARKFNGKIEDNVYRHFLNAKNMEADEARDVEDGYHVDFDWLKADLQVTAAEVLEAEQSFVFWRNHAAVALGADKRLDIGTENAAAINRSGDRPGGNQQAPAAGGVPPQ